MSLTRQFFHLPLFKATKLTTSASQATIMASNNIIFFFLSLLLLQAVSAVDYTVTSNAGGTPGGDRFDTQIGADYCRQTLIEASGFIWSIFRQNTDADRKNVRSVSLLIDRDYDGVAFASNNRIHVSANYIAGITGDVKREVTGIKLPLIELIPSTKIHFLRMRNKNEIEFSIFINFYNKKFIYNLFRN